LKDLEEDLNKTIKYLEKESKFQSFQDVQQIFLDKIKEIQDIL